MKRLMKRFGTGVLVCLLLMSAAACAWKDPRETAGASTGVKDPIPAGTGCYTYRDWVQQMPANWNPMEWSSQADAYILNYTGMGLYAAAADDTGTGYVLQPEMAASAPVDVTADYAGSEIYGVPAEAVSGYAYRIDLNSEAAWADGTAINADTYLYSLEQMLSSENKHSRASGFWTGQLCIANAYSYYMQDQLGTAVYRSLADAGYSSVTEAVNDGVKYFYLDMDNFWGMDCGWQPISSEALFRDEAVPEGMDEDMVSAKYLYETYLADGASYAAYQTTFVGIVESKVEKTSFEDVGLIKTGEYQITLVLSKPVSVETLQCNLTSGWLVQEELYALNYGTSVETSPSYGPYQLTELGEDYFRLERNESWYGYSDGRHEGQYQATAITCRVYADQAEALTAFQNGLLDTVELREQTEDSQLTPLTYVSKLTFNSSMTALKLRESEGVNKSILYYGNFRKAISLAIDRQAFVEACTPTSRAALGLLGNSFLSDLSSGEAYRDSAAGQSVLSKLYDTDDATAVTGYDKEAAAALFQQAYDAALADGHISETDVVELEFLVYSDDAVYDRIVSFLQNSISEAAVGTALEDRVRIVKTVDPDYYTAAKEGRFELILSTWGGVEWDPYSIMSCYCDEDKKFEFGFEPSVENCTITLGENQITKTYRGWYESLVNGKYAAADLQTRNEILAGLEYALLRNYNCVPLYERSLVTADSGRIARSLQQALPIIGFGGVRYAIFTLDDARWTEETGATF